MKKINLLLLLIIPFLVLQKGGFAQCDTATIYSNTTSNAVCFDTTDAKVLNCYSNNYPDHSDDYNQSFFTVTASEEWYSMCLYPDTASTFTQLYEVGTKTTGCSYTYSFGVAMNGIIFDPNSAVVFENTSTGEDNYDWHIEASSPEHNIGQNMGTNGGHLNPSGEYHYHVIPTDYYVNDLGIDGTSHSQIVGYAADGFPIYYKYVYSNANDAGSAITALSSGYALKSGSRPGDSISAPGGVYDGYYYEDYEYSTSTLDECNGRYGVTPDYPSGTYYYVLTDNYPYIPRCFKGTFVDHTFRIGTPAACPSSSASTDCSEAPAAVSGCMDPFSCNYNPAATTDDGSCEYYYDIATETVSTSGNYKASWGTIYSSTGTYYDTIVVSGGCDSVYSLDLTITGTCSGVTSQSNVSTCGGSDGSITLDGPFTGTPPFQFSVDNGVTFTGGMPPITYSSLSAGTYNTIFTDGGGCTIYEDILLLDASSITFTTTLSHPNCGSNDGSIVINASGSSGYNYSIDNGATYQVSNTFNALSDGSYGVVVKDASNCTASATAVLDDGSTLTFSTSVTDPSCSGNSDGNIVFTASGGTGSLEYSIDSGATYQSSNSFTSLSVGTYYTFVKDASGCTKTSSGTLTDLSELGASITEWELNTTGKTASYWELIGMDTFSFNTTTILADVLSVCYDDDNVYIQSEGMTNDMGQFTNPGSPTEQDFKFKFSRNPVAGSGSDEVPDVAGIGVLINGIMMFGLSDGTSYDDASNSNISMGGGLWVGDAYWSEGMTLDTAFAAHPQQAGVYHSHATPFRLYDDPVSSHSPLVGFANDGFPVYGPFGYASSMDNTSGITRMISGYELRNITDRTVLPDGSTSSPAGPAVTTGGSFDLGTYIQDYEFIDGVGTLDEHNGRLCVTPEYPNGTYAYFVTVDAVGTPQFPYYIGTTYYGTETTDNTLGSAVIPSSGLTCWDGSAALAFSSTITDPSCGTADGSVVLVASGGSSSSYQYSFDGGALQSSGSFSGYAAGTYDVIISDGSSCQLTDSITLSSASATTTITSQPVDKTVTEGGDESFTIAASNAGGYRWEVNTGSGWSNVTNGGVYTGAISTTLSITAATASMDGYMYRCRTRSSACNEDTSNSVTLTVSALVTATGCGLESQVTGWHLNTTGKTTSYWEYNPMSDSYTFNTSTTLADVLSVCYTDDTVYIETEGMTNDMGQFHNPGPVSAQDYEMKFPRNPVVGSGTEPVPEEFMVGMLVNGIPVFGLSDGTSYDIGSNSNSPMGQGLWVGEAYFSEGETLDTAFAAHPQQDGAYHSHATPFRLYDDPGTTHSPLVGFANDGFPIYGPFGYATAVDNSSGVTRMVSSYQLRNITTRDTLPDGSASMPPGPNVTSGGSFDLGMYIQDYEYIDGIGTLDEHNGRFCVTPEYPEGTYAYFVTVDLAGTPQFPFYVGTTYYGTPVDANNDGSAIIPTSGLTCWDGTEPLAYSDTITDASCSTADGEVILVADGGNDASYQYSFDGSGFVTSGTFGSLSAGTYDVIVQDADGCQVIDSIIVSSADAPVIDSINNSDLLCNGDTNGTIDVFASGGAGTYTYSMDNGTSFQAGNSFSGLTAASYNVVVKDASACESNASSITITEPDTINATVTVVDATCGASNGSIIVLGTGGTGTLSYSKDGGTSFQGSGTFSSLVGATYSLVIQDLNSCQVSSTETISDLAGPIISNVVVADMSCNNISDGTITITATGGNGTLSYIIDGGATYQASNSFTSLSNATYSVMVQDTNNCSASSSGTIANPAVVSYSASITDASCGGTNGAITLNGSGGNGGAYTYSFDGSAYQSSGTFTGFAASTYNVGVKDVDGCEVTSTESISNTGSPTISNIVSTDPKCNAGTDGTIIITATGGTGSLEYSVDNGGSFHASNAFNGLSATSYNVVVKDGSGCQVTSSETLSEPAAVSYTSASTDETCTSGNGTITLAGSGGTGSLSYSIDGGGSSQSSGSFSSLTASTFNVVVEDSNACQATGSLSISDLTGPSITSVSTTDMSCNNISNGTITIIATGGNGTLNYSVDGGSTYQASNSFTSLSNATYSVMVQDTNSCTASSSGTIANPAVVSYSASITDASCGGTNGAITLTGSGGNGGAYTYSFDGSAYQSSGTFTGFAASTYNVGVKDVDGCEVTSTESISNTGSPTISSVVSTDPKCNAGSDGTIIITATGGTGSLEYSVDNGATYQTNNSFSGLSATSYNVVVEDASGCQVTSSTTLSDPTAVSYTSSSTNETCGAGNGTITLSGSGGTGTLSYSIDNGVSSQSSGSFSSLTAATFNILVEDSNACQTTGNMVVSNLAGPSISSVTATDMSCNNVSDGTITISATGGNGTLSYSIDGGSTYQTSNSFASLSNATYSVMVQDTNNCTASSSGSIANPAVVSYSASITDASCGGTNGAITLTGSGGNGGAYTYSFDGSAYQSSGTFTGFAASTYNVGVKDVDGCEVTSTESISNTGSPTISSIVSTDPKCNAGTDGTIIITATGGTGSLEYSVDNGGSFHASNAFNGLSATSYNVVVKDASGCQVTSSTALSNPTAVSYFASSTDETCSSGNGAITLSGSGGTGTLSYSIDNGGSSQSSGSFTSLTAGSFNIVVEDSNACQATGSLSISDLTGPSISNVTATDMSCNNVSDGTITITASGGNGTLSYSIDGGATYLTSNSFTSLSNATYSVMVQDSNNCSASSSGAISNPAAVSYSASITDASCGGTNGAITLTGSGGNGGVYTYSFDGSAYQSSGTFNGFAASTYNIGVKDVDGCEVTSTESISNTGGPSISSVATTDPTCNGGTGSITITATGGTGSLEYSIDNGTFFQTSNSFSGLSVASYNVVVEDASGCQANSSAAIMEPLALGLSITSNDPLCNNDMNGTITLSGSGGTGSLSYSIDNGSSTQASGNFTSLAATTYNILLEDSNSCTLDTTVTLTNPTTLSYTHVTSNASCGSSDGSISITATGGDGSYLYSLDGATGQVSNSFNMLPASSYLVEVEDGNNCTYSETISIVNPSAPSFGIPTTTDPLCNGDSTGDINITATGGSGTLNYSINGGTSQSSGTFTSLPAGTFTIEVSDVNMCVTQEVVTLSDPAALSGSATSTDVLCFGGADGEIEITAIGGTGALEYSIDGGTTYQVSNVFGSLSMNSYSTVVKDANDCEISIGIETISEPTQLAITGVVTNENTGSDGAIDITVTGGVGTYTFDWDNDGTGDNDDAEDLSGLVKGVYVVHVADTNGCTLDSSFEVDGTIGIEEDLTLKLTLYPNPVINSILVELENQQQFEYQIHNVIGELVAQGTARNKIEVNFLAPGFYNIILNQNEQTYHGKFLKE